MEETIDLQELFQILKKRLRLVIVLALIAMAISGAVTHYLITPIYQASTQLVVSRSDADLMITGAEITGINQIMSTFTQVILSPRILDQVIAELGLSETPSSLEGRMEARNASQVLILTVRHENPESAYNIANKTAEIFAHDIPDILNFDNVSILAPALLPRNPVSPRLVMNIVIGFVVGAMIGMFLAFLLEFLDKTVKTEQDVEKLVNLPVLGMIPAMTADDFKVKRVVNDLD